MLDWIKNIGKEYPDFWKKYLKKFDEKSNKFVVLTTETTGLNPNKDVILSIGCVTVQNDLILIGESFEVVLLQYVFNHDNQMSNEFIIESKQEKLTEANGVKKFVEFLQNAVIVGHRIDFDIEIINEALKKMSCGSLKNEALDIEIMYRKWIDNIDEKPFSIEEMCQHFKIENTLRNSTSEDAFLIGLLFLKLKSRLKFK
jgi:DNA polymerase III subunit epsilon